MMNCYAIGACIALLAAQVNAKQPFHTIKQSIQQPIEQSVQESDYDYAAKIDLSVNRHHVGEGIYGMNFMYDEVPSDSLAAGLVGSTRSGGGSVPSFIDSFIV